MTLARMWHVPLLIDAVLPEGFSEHRLKVALAHWRFCAGYIGAGIVGRDET